MRAEYKRDINGNYLMLYEKEEPDTSSYQMRMLVGNTIPSILKCRMQGIDGQFMVCFDITSKQSVLSLYEEKKMGYEDLQMILGGFVQVMEEMAEYLLNPCRLILKPEYMYVDVERRQLYFCYLPGYDQDIREKFQELTEYILPILDHEDSRAVMLGYGIYRRALEDSFHLEYIKKELYQEREETGKTGSMLNTQKADLFLEPHKCVNIGEINENIEKELTEGKTEIEEQALEKGVESLMWQDEEPTQKGSRRLGNTKGILLWCVGAAVVALLVVTAETLGYLPQISVAVILGVIIAGMGIGMLSCWLVSMRKRKREKNSEVENEVKENIGKSYAFDKEISELEKNIQERDVQEKNIQRYGKRETAPEEKSIAGEKRKITEETKMSISQKNCGETVVLSANIVSGPATLVSREPGELATIYLQDDLTVIGKMETAADAVVNLPTVSRIHAKIRRRDGEYYLTDLNSRNGTSVNGKMLKGDEDYCLQDQDEVDFAQARYVFLK